MVQVKKKFLLYCMALGLSVALGGCGKSEILQEGATYILNAYFFSDNSDFYERITCNPIDQNHVIDRKAAPLEIWQSALKKCEAWNQQIDSIYLIVSGI